ncbi:hypothetical protein AX16_004020 [Volvariella volvacea WC 439]|nr:hypothetical protein AX16_004020 [Volvariella volvacea WC 439]
MGLGGGAEDEYEHSSGHGNANQPGHQERADIATLERKTIRQVDFRILPLLGILYALAVIDRSNLGIARVVGMDHDLGLSIGSRYSILSAIYFVPYIFFQLPSNLVLRSLGVRHWMAFCVVSWGIVQLAMGFVPTWKLLAFCRVLLGAFEAGFFPAMVLIITTWYRRHEVQKRLAAFYVLSIVAGGSSAFLGYCVSLLAGTAGIAGWAWIFVIEGIVTVVFGVFSWFYIPEFPDQNNFLSLQQTQFVLQRIEEDRGDSLPDYLTIEKVLRHLRDWKLWAYAIMYLCATMPAYAIGFFITLILRGMGWGVTESLLLSTPPYIVAAISVVFFSWLSDKHRLRGPFIAFQVVITLIGLILIGYTRNSGWRYAGIFLSNAGSAGEVAGILAYSSNNIISQSKRTVTTAMVVSFGGVGGILATTVFRQVDFPNYLPGILATIACQVILLGLLIVTTCYFWNQNQRVKAGTIILEERPGFLYTL